MVNRAKKNLHHVKQSVTGALKAASKRAIQKTEEIISLVIKLLLILQGSRGLKKIRMIKKHLKKDIYLQKKTTINDLKLI